MDANATPRNIIRHLKFSTRAIAKSSETNWRASVQHRRLYCYSL
ncbi:hypothetical protein ACU8KH_02251 [Lachancea thermotolerans]